MTRPDFDDLVGSDLAPGERARLLRAHEALITAGPPPDLPPSLAVPPGSPAAEVVRPLPHGIPRRRLVASLVLAAAVAVAAFGAGFLVGDRSEADAFRTDFVVPMRGTDAAPTAIASLDVGEQDKSDNWPMILTVRELPRLPEGDRYELLLTKKGRPAVSCGTFQVAGKTVVYLNAPYRLRQYDGWVITREDSDEILVRTAKV
ncbi:MAG: anti-sigma factor domain-containing protein [Gaiellaceae bacterium]